MSRIVLDAGHGGHDSGATGNGLREKDLCLDIVKRIERQLKQYEGANVRLTRSNDTFVTLTERANIANNFNADLFVSVHINAFTNTTANGFETFRFTTVSARTRSFQNVLHTEIMKQIDLTDRGL
jgi:N-acetylmuramoyl-L-alanine amidase